MYGELYLQDLNKNMKEIDLKFLYNKSILITGATGLICSYIVDELMLLNEVDNANVKVYALGRNLARLEDRFSKYKGDQNLNFVVQDVCEDINLSDIDYIVHGASNANPKLYFSDPVGTMLGNFLGMYNVLELAKKRNSKVIYISSSEVYGDMRDTKEPWKEEESGYVNPMNYRSSYPNSKRASEGLCASYSHQYNVDTFVIRLCYVYGPTMTKGDNRAVSSFIRNVVNDEDIVMKSEGKASRCYCYVGDAFKAIMYVLSHGFSGEAYNLSSLNNVVSIKELAFVIANSMNKKLIMDIPNINEGYSNVELILMSSEKLDNLGFKVSYSIEDGIKTTIDILKENKQ